MNRIKAHPHEYDHSVLIMTVFLPLIFTLVIAASVVAGTYLI